MPCDRGRRTRLAIKIVNPAALVVETLCTHNPLRWSKSSHCQASPAASIAGQASSYQSCVRQEIAGVLANRGLAVWKLDAPVLGGLYQTPGLPRTGRSWLACDRGRRTRLAIKIVNPAALVVETLCTHNPLRWSESSHCQASPATSIAGKPAATRGAVPERSAEPHFWR